MTGMCNILTYSNVSNTRLGFPDSKSRHSPIMPELMSKPGTKKGASGVVQVKWEIFFVSLCLLVQGKKLTLHYLFHNYYKISKQNKTLLERGIEEAPLFPRTVPSFKSTRTVEPMLL